MSAAKSVVIALGGNAMLQAKEKGDYDTQRKNVEIAASEIYKIYKAGFKVVLTSGNGPQVGAIKLQNQAAAEVSPEMPLHVCGAMSQGFIGYMMTQAMDNVFKANNEEARCVTCITQTLVDPKDQAFTNPTKPVGRFYTEQEAKELMKSDPTKVLREDAGRGWRVVVPSPRPLKIVECDIIKSLITSGVLVICANGGGIPCKCENNVISGVDAVIDKDLATSLLAQILNVDYLMILTDVPNACINYKKPDERKLEQIKLSEILALEKDGHFAAGSMGPKVRAAIEFTQATGKMSIITSLNTAVDALNGKCGTRITKD